MAAQKTPYKAIAETERTGFSSFQRVPQNVSKADAKVAEIAREAARYLAMLESEAR